jgi:preprotein translocase subunit SecE
MVDKIKNFFNDVVKEMKKVTWPTKAELQESTVVVIVVSILFAVFTYIIDIGLVQILKGIF